MDRYSRRDASRRQFWEPMHVLVVEHDFEFAAAMARAFRLERIVVDIADRARALAMTHATKYDVIIIAQDVASSRSHTPLERQLRERGYHGPMLVLLADSTSPCRDDHGADQILRRPFAVSDVVSSARTLVARSTSTRAHGTRPHSKQ